MTPEISEKLKSIVSLPSTLQQINLAAFLSKLFAEKDVDFTIVGGAAVQFYTQAVYTTKDLDAVLAGDTKEIVEEVMEKVGFKRTTSYRHFENPLFDFWVEFPPSPVSVASRTISKVAIVETEEGSVRIIRIEDIIMDRITAGVEWKDKPSLEQAKLLWQRNKNQIDKNYLTDFAEKEGYLKVLKEVMGPITSSRKRGR